MRQKDISKHKKSSILHHLALGREEGSGCKSQRQKPASFGFSARNLGGKIL